MQDVLQPHFTSSLQAFNASRRVVQCGAKEVSLACCIQPHSSADGIIGSALRDWPQMNPAMYVALFACFSRALEVGGKFSIFLFWENNRLCRSFTFVSSVVFWYRRVVNLSISSNWLDERCIDVSTISANSLGRFGNEINTLQAVFSQCHGMLSLHHSL